MKRIKIMEMIDRPFLGGGQINLLSLAKSLDRAKFEVSVCSQYGGPLMDEVQKNNIKYFPVPFSKKIKRKIVPTIASILKENRIDILHTHGGVAGLYGRWAASKCSIPVIIHTLHGIHYLHYRNIFLKFFYVLLERYFSCFTDALIFVSDGDRKKGQKFRLSPEEKMFLIKNGIDFSAFESRLKKVNNKVNKIEELGFKSSQPIVGTVARLHRQKGIIYLLKAAKRISQAFPEVKIIIVGDGPLRHKLERSTQILGLEKSILFMGERKDVPEILSLFDIFVLPSLWEGLPYALIEAAVAAKPVVCTDVDGTRELIKNTETGILVPPKNPERLAQAVISLLQDRDYASKLGEKLKKEISRRYTLSRMVEETKNLYLRLYKKN